MVIRYWLCNSLWEAMTKANFYSNYSSTLSYFYERLLGIWWYFGKWPSLNLKFLLLAIFVFTIVENRGLFCVVIFSSFFLFCVHYPNAILYFRWNHFCLRIFRRAFVLSDTSLDNDFLDNILLLDFGGCFSIWGGWLKLMSIYFGPLLGFLNAWWDSFFKFLVI